MTVIYFKEEKYNQDRDIFQEGIIFKSKETAYKWLKNRGYTNIRKETYPENKIERWMLKKENSETHAIIFEASFYESINKYD